MKRLTVLAALGFLALSCSGAAAERPAPVMGDMIVVGHNFEALGSHPQFCVRYRAFEQTEETCLHGPTSNDATDFSDFFDCYTEAVVGEPLPEVCR